MDLTLYLRKDRVDKKTGMMPIHGRVCWGGSKLRFSTGEWAKETDWDSEWQLIKPKAPKATKTNQRISAISTALKTLFDHSFVPPSIEAVRKEIDRVKREVLGIIHKPKPAEIKKLEGPAYPSVIDFFPQYISDMRSERSPEWRRSVKVVGSHLAAFMPSIDWPDLKLNTLNQFKAYLQEEEEASDNTIATYISLIRGLCDYAEQLEIGIPIPRSWKWVTSKPAKVIRPVLTYADVNRLRDAKLSREEELSREGELWDYLRDPDLQERIRWYFLMSCYTGLRKVDQPQLIDPRITTIEGVRCLVVMQQKTGNQVPIPLTDDAYHLLRNPVDKKKLPDNTEYNRVIKAIGKQAGLNRIVITGSFYKGELITDRLPLHETLSCHMARRTFASLLTDANLNTLVLQQIMGHKSVASTEKYVTVTDNAIVHQTLTAWKNALKAA